MKKSLFVWVCVLALFLSTCGATTPTVAPVLAAPLGL